MEDKNGIIELMEKAQQGDVVAQNALGLAYEKGDGVEQIKLTII